MKKMIEKEVTLCDSCEKEAYLKVCIRCGVEHCYECKKFKGIEYTNGVRFSGTGDGYYCNECDGILFTKEHNDLHFAYVIIRNLKTESQLYYADFSKRSTAAEDILSNLWEKYNEQN